MSKNYQDSWDQEDEDYLDEEESNDSAFACPECKREIYHDAEQCPHCGFYITDEAAEIVSRPAWVKATAIICLLVFLFSMWIAWIQICHVAVPQE
jgi:uncharacterized paraquat-inducible protein A